MEKLIKINTDHYVIVDDSEIKEGDLMIRDGEQPALVTPNFWWDFGVPYKKITHSTQPLEEGTTIHGIEHKRWVHVKYIDLQEVKELIGVVDVEKLFVAKYNPRDLDLPIDGYFRKGWETGYNQAIEDNKEKKYTEEQVKEACRLFVCGKTLDSCIKSLQPKTEWEVEFVDGKLKLK